MVGTLLPIGHGERRRGKQPLVLWAHAAGNAVAGAAAGAALAGLGLVLARLAAPAEAVAMLLVGTVAAVYSLREAGLWDVRIPCRSRQVAQQRLRRDERPRWAAFVYGLGLGYGFGTYIPVGTFLVLATWVVVAPNVAGIAAMALFGAARALPLFLLGTATGSDHVRLAAASDRLFLWQPLVHLGNGLVLALVAAYLVTGSWLDFVSRLGGS